MGDDALEALLGLDGGSYEVADGLIVEFTVKRTEATAARPHGIYYALVFRPVTGAPYVKFDNAHPVSRPGGRFVKRSPTYDHWHRDERDPGRPYAYSTPMQLLEDFQAEVKRILNEKGVPNDL
jgi:hypothetical protein